MTRPHHSPGSRRTSESNLRRSRAACVIASLFFLALLASGANAADGKGGPPVRRPSVLLVLADDLGWSDIGCHGGEIPTPHVDALARDGLRFSQFYNNSICGPTRASLLTGLYCQQTGHPGDRWNEPMDFRRCATIAEVLKPAGYRTAMVGKWQSTDLPAVRGFDRFFGPMCQGKISYFDEVDLNPYRLDRDPWTPPEDFYLTDALNDFSVEFLEEAVRDDRPFFLYVAHLAPHWPLHAREADIAPHRARYRELGWDTCRAERWRRQQELGLVPKEWKISPRPAEVPDWTAAPHRDWQAERMAVYAAQVASIDRGLGRLLEVLDRAGRRDDTVVMFLSDNGAAPDGGIAPTNAGFGFAPGRPANATWRKDGVAIRPGSGPNHPPGPHDTFAAYGLAWATTSGTPWRGMKTSAYEGGIRTPLVVRWPQVIREGGRITPQVGHVIDLLPTFADLAGAKHPPEFPGRKMLPVEGRSLRPIFEGRERAPHESLCWSISREHAIRQGRWKAIRSKVEGSPWHLYDLEADGTETTDLAARHPDRTKEMAAAFTAWQRRVGAN